MIILKCRFLNINVSKSNLLVWHYGNCLRCERLEGPLTPAGFTLYDILPHFAVTENKITPCKSTVIQLWAWCDRFSVIQTKGFHWKSSGGVRNFGLESHRCHVRRSRSSLSVQPEKARILKTPFFVWIYWQHGELDFEICVLLAQCLKPFLS